MEVNLLIILAIIYMFGLVTTMWMFQDYPYGGIIVGFFIGLIWPIFWLWLWLDGL